MTNYYAGIGSRETPLNIMNIMYACGCHMASKDWVLRSGHAIGADQSFERGAANMKGKIESYLPWRGYNGANEPSIDNILVINPSDYPFSQEEMDFTASYHPAWKKCSPSTRLLHQRNTRIILGTEAIHGALVQPVKFIICWTIDGKITGGTGQALRIAKALEIPVINFGSAKNTKELETMILEIETMVEKYHV